MRAVKIPWFHSSAKAPRSPIPASLPLFLSHPRAHLPADARSGSRRALLFPAIPSYSHAIPTHVSSPISLPAGCTGAGQDQDHAGTLNWHQQPLSPTGEQPGVTSAPGRGVQIPHSPDSLQRDPTFMPRVILPASPVHLSHSTKSHALTLGLGCPRQFFSDITE